MKSPKIIELPPTELTGLRIKTSTAKNETRSLWERFQKMLITAKVSPEIEKYSVQVFDADTTISNMNPHTEFEKWAAVASKHFSEVPKAMETISISGKYAVFMHKGLPSDFPKTAAFIFGEWMPKSGFRVDQRPHFEIMPVGYSPFDSTAEEEIWVPIK